MTHTDILKLAYDNALKKIAEKNTDISLSKELQSKIENLVENSEKSKAVITVIITLLAHKIYNPAQDIRFHQAKLENGFSGRNIDKAEVTPF